MRSFQALDQSFHPSWLSQLDTAPERAIISCHGSHHRVVLDPAVLHGKPVIRGTRLPVTVVVGSLAGGMTFEEVQREYDLTADDIRLRSSS